MTGKILILGMGNTLLGDEGVGVHTVRTLQNAQTALGNIEVIDGGTLSFVLAGPIEDAACLIVVDAAQLSRAPGTVRLYEGAEMDRFVMSSRNRSVHEVSLSDLLVIAHLSDRLPPRRALIGIQPECIDWSDSLSPPVAAAVPLARKFIRALLLRWAQRDQPTSRAPD